MCTSMESASPDHVDESQHHIKLACQACQRKKIKCDRTLPCGQCQRSNLQCHPSTRKPRGRLVGKRTADSELRSRITKLESLVETLNGDATAGPGQQPIEQGDAPSGRTHRTLPAVGKYIASPFWATLSTEFQALREALEDDASDGEDMSGSSDTRSPNGIDDSNHELIICPPASIYVMPGALPRPQPQRERQLYDIFLHNVDPVFKVLHRPTLKRWLERGEDYLGHGPESPPNRCLKKAMWFAAIATLHDDSCFARFGQPRADLIHQYRRHVDVALAQADLLNTSNLATLQAFVLYTASTRITDPTRRSWVNTGLIVRIATGMGLHHEAPSDSLYSKELKRRLWHQIRVLDAFAAVDRGSELLIAMNSFDTPLPSNCNDADFDESTREIPARNEGLSDMTFNLMAHMATSLTMRLLKPETEASKGETWQQRLDLALSFGKELREKYLQYCDLYKPFHRFLYAVGGSMSASSVLRAVRPMQRHVSSVPPRVDSPFVLQLAVNSLRETEATHQDPEAEGWRWIFWVQWHALAVALAGLCSIRDTELASTAWKYAEKAYCRQFRQIADTNRGMLWRPIEKLYKKACAFRDDNVSSNAGSISSPDANPTGLSSPALPYDTSIPHSLPAGQAPPPAGGGTMSNPMNPLMEYPMVNDGFAGLSSLECGGLSWADWQNIMSDIQPQQDGLEPLPSNSTDWMNNPGFTDRSRDGVMGNLQQTSGAIQGVWPNQPYQQLL